MRKWRHAWTGVVLLGTLAKVSAGDIGKIAPEVLDKEQRTEARRMIDHYIKGRIKEANSHHLAEWYKVKTRKQWEMYRDERIDKLRASLGEFPTPGKLNWRQTGVVKGDGFHIENIVYESLQGQWVTGNLYVPGKPAKSMPGIVIAHAHHRDKPQPELQDMGMTWARAGCLVLVIDQVGYGERRSHPFHLDKDYAKPFKTTRQDYYFRYDTGIQLQLLGDSLMGWMVWDLRRGVDLLLSRDGIDPKRIIILGAVAGGGDPAGVTAALDRRIAGCVPFNFGGSQPETPYPLPDDAETSYNYAGWTYWDSTRGLRLSVRDDFLHWVIVASTAPRFLITAHEFAWDRERDPVWKRYQKIWGEFYAEPGNIGFTHGKGSVKQSAAEATHCTNIGKVHRRMIHPLFDKWFDIKVAEKDEFSAPRKRDELICMTDNARKELKPHTLNEAMSSLGTERIGRARARLAGKTSADQRQILRDEWGKLLGPVTPMKPPIVKAKTMDDQPMGGAKVERVILEVEPGIVVPVLILVPVKRAEKAPVVIGIAQAGKFGFLKERANDIEKLIQAGVIVVLPDLRDTGETRPGEARGKGSSGTNHSVYLQLFGETVLGQQLRDLRSVIAYLRQRPEMNSQRIGLWGESFAPTNGPDTNFKLPREADTWPRQSEPLGGLLCLLGALFENDVRAVHITGGLVSYHAVLGHFAVLIPHDASVPGALTTGDLCDLAGSLAPRPLRFEAMVDHLNRPVTVHDLRKAYDPTVRAYAATPGALGFADERATVGTWLAERLK